MADTTPVSVENPNGLTGSINIDSADALVARWCDFAALFCATTRSGPHLFDPTRD
jgi:hypothetical protein